MKLFSFIVLLFVGVLTYAQDVKFTASAPSVVALGEQFKLSYSINKQGSNLEIPTLEGFDLLMGPNKSESSSFFYNNGKQTQSFEIIYTYVLEGVKEGVYQIPAATIVVDGKKYQSNALKIQVVKGNNSAAAGQAGNQSGQTSSQSASNTINDENLFVQVEVSRKSMYIGESLVATIKVYSKVELAGFGRSKFPAFEGFLSEELPMPDRIELTRGTYNGQIYNIGVLRRLLLFPQQTGEITIDPFELECVVNQRLGGSRSFFDDFFGNVREVRVMRRSRPVTINVKELPQDGKPVGFSGTVGNVTMSTSVSADTVNANDAITYKITFKGNGNLKLLKAPKVNFPYDFETYDPKETKDIRTTESGMLGSITFEYLIIPRYSGDYQIPAVYSFYFDVQSGVYKNLYGQGYNIHVRKGAERTQGTGGNAIQSFKKEDVRTVGEDIRYLRTGDIKLHKKGVRFFATWMYGMALLGPFLIFVIGAILNRRRIKANADLARVKNRAANKMAHKRMKVAANAMKNRNAEQFYEEVLKALWGYVSYKLNIDKVELNRDNITGILQQKTVDHTIIQEFMGVLDECEYARYAPGSNIGQEMDRIYMDGIKIITKLDKIIK